MIQIRELSIKLKTSSLHLRTLIAFLPVYVCMQQTDRETMTEETASGGPVRDPAPDNGIPEEGVQPRGKWAHKMEFIFSMAAEIIGLGNVLHFPYLCYRNGGGE